MSIVKQEWFINRNSSQWKRKNTIFFSSKKAIIRKRKQIHLFLEENAHSDETDLQSILLKDALVMCIICIGVVL